LQKLRFCLGVKFQFIGQRKGLENQEFSNWNPQAETALFAEENREFQDQRSLELICLASVSNKKKA
jgi:hypothetical protein